MKFQDYLYERPNVDLLKENLFNPNYYHEDYVLWMQLLKNGAKAVGDSSVLSYYRLVTGSRSSNKKNAALHRWKIYRENRHVQSNDKPCTNSIRC